MANKLVVYKNRTNIIELDMGEDISGDTWTSEIRAEQDHNSQFLMAWVVTFVTDGTDGLLRLQVDDLVTEQIESDAGYMDVLRVTGGEPIPTFDRALEVEFRGTVTAP